MPAYHVLKETAVPAEIIANAIYIIRDPARPDFIEIYVSNAAGTATYRTMNQVDVQAMIDAAVAGSAGGSGTMIVDTIASRDAIPAEDRPNALHVLVLDASADATVDSGAATYVWRESNQSFIKVSESESMDFTLTWGDIEGIPTSSPAAIDAAVTNSHTHANKTQLDKITEDANGNMLYAGQLPKTGWNSTNW